MFQIFFSRIYREKVTIIKMIHNYCEKYHSQNNGNLCPDCNNLLEYAFKRLDFCPYSERKPACNKCPIHCYKSDMRQKIRLVMRFSGPKMLFKHPLLALLHLYDRRKEPPVDFPKKSKIEENKKIGQMETCPNENQVES